MMYYTSVCRVFPEYIAKNYEYFEVLPPPRFKVTDLNKYVTRIKQKISCMKTQDLL